MLHACRPGAVPTFAQSCFLLAFLVLIGFAGQSAQAAQAQLDQDRVGKWLDKEYAAAVEQNRVVGAIVAVIDRGHVTIMRGYGAANIETGMRADPARTPFRSGSVTKLLTGIAIMQLVEQKKVDLDAPIGRYIRRFTVDQSKGTITVRHLLTHSSGLAQRWRGTMTRQSGDGRAATDDINRFLPVQMTAPGRFTSYSNTNMALLGEIISAVTGLAYPDYISMHIFRPLGMRDSFFEVFTALPAHAAREHAIDASGTWTVQPYFNKAPFYLPSGGHFWTATDAAKLMRAMLDRDPALLSEPSWSAMMRTQRRNTAHGGMGLSFVITQTRQADPEMPDAIGHSGLTGSFSSNMMLFPHRGVGIFVAHVGTCPASNAWQDDGCAPPLSARMATASFGKAFALLPLIRSPSVHVNQPALSAFVGTYRPLREGSIVSRDDLYGYLADFGDSDTKNVRRIDGHTIDVTGMGPFKRVGALDFRSPDGSEELRFLQDDRGRIEAVATSPIDTFTRDRTFISGKVIWALIAAMLAAAIAGSIILFGMGCRAAASASLTAALATLAALLFPPVDHYVLKTQFRLVDSDYPLWISTARIGGAAALAALVWLWRAARYHNGRRRALAILVAVALVVPTALSGSLGLYTLAE